MPFGVLPYQQGRAANAMEGIAALLQGVAALKEGMARRKFGQRSVGDVLGQPSQPTPARPNMMLTPTDTRPQYMKDILGPQVPMGAPGRPSFPGAPAGLQGLLGTSVRDFRRMGSTVGDGNMRALMALMAPKSAFDENSLFYNPNNKTFDLVKSEGSIPTSPRKASIIQGQTRLSEDVKNKERLSRWRSGVEARMRRGGISKEILAGLKNDLALIDLRLDEGFEDMDETEQKFINSQVGAALSRWQRFGVNPTKEVSRKTTDVYGDKKPIVMVDQNTDEDRFNALKAEFPDMSDDEIMALIAMEGAGAQ